MAGHDASQIPGLSQCLAVPDWHRLALLAEGDSTDAVQALLGEPTVSSPGDRVVAWHYTLVDVRRGWMPCVLVFSAPGGALLHWFLDQPRLRAYGDLWAALVCQPPA